MIAPLTFAVVRARLLQVLGGLALWVVAAVAVPPAFAGDRNAPETTIVTGPDLETPSTTADFTFESTADRAAFFCMLDDSPEFVSCETPWHVEGLAPGAHVLWVYSLDLKSELADQTPAMWEWTVVEGPPADAGSPDAGSPGGDGGPGGETDGGVPGGDAGTGDEDAGSSDAGSPDAGSSGGDGGPSGNEDAGTSGNEDAGSPAGDAGTEDAGSPGGGADGGDEQPGPPPSDDGVPPEALDYLGGGVGCTGAPAPGALAGLLLLAWVFRRRHRR